MGVLSSINLEPSKDNNVEHNTRKISPTYLLKESSLGVEFNRNSVDAIKLFDELLEESTFNYTTRTGQRLQSQNYKWSAVVNIKEDTTMQDLEKLSERLNKEFGWQCYQISIHRDEGFKDQETGKTEYNLHAHLEFLMLDKQGIYCFKKRDWGKKKMSELQDLVAKELNMQRGETQQDRLKKIAILFKVDVNTIQRKKNEKYYDFCQRLNKIAEEKGIKNFSAGAILKGRSHMNHYDYKAMKRNEDALRHELNQERTQNEVLKQESDYNFIRLQETAAKNEILRADLLNIKDRLAKTELALSDAPVKTQKELDTLKSQIRKEMITEGGFTQEEYMSLNEVVKGLKALLKEQGQKFTAKIAVEAILEGLNSKQLKKDLSDKTKQIETLNTELLSIKKQNEIIQAERKKYIADGNHIKEEYQKLLKLKDALLTKEQLDNELQKLRNEYEQRIFQKDCQIDKLKSEITVLTAKLDNKPTTVEKVIEKVIEKPVERIITKTETKLRPYSSNEIEQLPRVQNLLAENANLRAENKALNSLVEEYEDGICMIAQRIDDEGHPEIADAILREKSVKGAFEIIADYIISTLKKTVKKVTGTINSVFHR